jgi:hypothetical protein
MSAAIFDRHSATVFDRRPQPSSRSPGGGGDGSLVELVIVHPADHKRVRAEYRGVAGEVGRRFAELNGLARFWED